MITIFENRLRTIRISMGLSREQFSHIVGWSVSKIRRIDDGRQSLNTREIIEACKALNLPTVLFFGESILTELSDEQLMKEIERRLQRGQ